MLDASMSAAKLAGSDKYFTGRACKHGHIAARYTYSGSCVACHRMWTELHRKAGRHKRAFSEWYANKRRLTPEYFLHQAAKRRAKELGIPFDLALEDIRVVWPSDNCCPVTRERFTDVRAPGSKRRPNTPSLDRLRPERGYVPGNIAVISMRANHMKTDVTDPALFRRMADWLELVLTLP